MSPQLLEKLTYTDDEVRHAAQLLNSTPYEIKEKEGVVQIFVPSVGIIGTGATIDEAARDAIFQYIDKVLKSAK